MKHILAKSIIAIFLLAGVVACTTEQVLNAAGKVLAAQLTEGEVGDGLKEALVQGISEGVGLASKADGYNKSPLIRIPFPPEAEKIASTLTKIGLGAEVEKFTTTLNRGAEAAALEAKPIFISAIKAMTIQDAFNILKGDKTAATEYLKRTTYAQLFAAFQPKVEAALQQVNATKHYSELVGKYNSLPTTFNKLNPDLNKYATEKAIEGLFLLVGKEELRIRENVGARKTQLLQKVFAAQDPK